MAVIPGIPEREMLRSAGPANVKLDAGALNAPNRAAMQLAGSIEQLGATANDIYQKHQDAKNTADLIDAQGKLAKTKQNFIENLQKNSDESTWVKSWQDTVKETQDGLIGKDSKLAPDVKRHLTLEMKDWGTTNEIDVRNMAFKAQNQRGRVKIDGAVDEYTKNGDEKSAMDAIASGVKVGLFSPEQGDVKKQQVGQQIDYYAAMNFIVNHPVGAVDFLGEKTRDGKYKNLSRLDETQRHSLLKEARHTAIEYQGDNLSNIVGIYEAYPKAAMSKERLQDMVDAKKITEKGAAAYTKMVEETELKHSKTNYDLLNGEIISTDLSKMKQEDRDAWKTQIIHDSIPLATVHRNSLTRSLNAKLKSVDAKDEKVENKVKTQTIEQMHRDFTEGYVLPGQKVTTETEETVPGTGFMGFFRTHKTKDTVVPADESQRKGWMNNADLDTVNATKVRFAQELGKMDDFFEQHAKDNGGKGPSYEEAEQFRQKLMEPYLAESVSKALTGQLPAPDAAPAAATPKFEKGKKYKDAKGNVATWNGTDWE